MKYFIQKFFFNLRFHFTERMFQFVRTKYFSLLGMEISMGNYLPTLKVNWPHQVKIGKECTLEPGINFKYDGIWKPGPSIIIGNNVFVGLNCEFNIQSKIVIGNHALIASGCKFIDHDHGIENGMLMRLQLGVKKDILIGEDVWIGCNSVILKGVTIGDGAIIGAGSVLTKPVPPGEMWAGVPARKIGERR